jgi:hypothetical protein
LQPNTKKEASSPKNHFQKMSHFPKKKKEKFITITNGSVKVAYKQTIEKCANNRRQIMSLYGKGSNNQNKPAFLSALTVASSSSS